VRGKIAPVLGEVLTAIVTPFDKDGAVDYDRFRALARHVIESGADGLVVAATTGESPTLTDEERLELWAASVDEVGERATVVASTGTYSTTHSVHLTEQAHELGVDGFLVVTPYYNKPPPRGIVEHFKAIAAASDKPIIVYNIPQRVVVNIEPDTMIELAEIPTVKAVKQATEELDQAQRIVDETDLDLYAGSDHLVYPFLEVGGMGGVIVHGNLVPGRVKEMIRFYKEGDVETARTIDEELKPLVDVLGVTINPIPVKAALNLLGHEVGGLRLPLVEASEEELTAIRSGLERAGLTAPARV
jgi:4-hydroxy-tetrahydrodipicolinate synthase